MRWPCCAVACLLVVVPGAAAAAGGPLKLPTGSAGALRVSGTLRLDFPIPAGLSPYETVNGTRQEGAYSKTVTAGSVSCQVVLRVQGRVQRSRPTVASLSDDTFVAARSGRTGARHWTVGRQAGGTLAISWRAAPPSTRALGRYVAVTAYVQAEPAPDEAACSTEAQALGAAARTVAERWVVTRR
jgi:hypothetical protein